MERRGLMPRLLRPDPGSRFGGAGGLRQAAASLLLFVVLWLTVFASLGLLGTTTAGDFQAPPTPSLFLVHLILLATLAIWYALAFLGPGQRTTAAVQYGLRARSVAVELGLGVVAGVAAWLVVLSLLVGVGALVVALGGEDALPREAPPIVPWIASLPLALRLAISASAGCAEELFFRGFLQPRVGIPLSTALFALAHLSYDQPAMLVGVTLLSLSFAFLVRWRQSIWAAMVAHAVFDAIQLVFVIPLALRYVESNGSDFLLACWPPLAVW